MPLIATQSSIYAPTGATTGGTAVYTSGASTTVSIEEQPVLLDGTIASVSGATNGTVVNASGTITFILIQNIYLYLQKWLAYHS
jgi:hypothetical protein